MNWTGGQLQRHHTRSGLLTKAQKQNFAKSRLKSTAIPPSSPFRNFPEGPSEKRDDATKTGANRYQAGESVSHLPALETDRTAGASKLSDIKRQLLEESDWAAVSATRPLELAFTSAAETERFGKRRRLNDNDRKRVADNGLAFFELPGHRVRNSSSVIDTIEEIQVEIDGRPAVQSYDSSGVINSLSSQSMLFDHEGSTALESDTQKEHLTATWINNMFARPR